MNEPKPTRPVADDLNVATSFARGVTLTKTRYDDEYRGEPDACVAAGLIKYDQVPGRPGFNKTSATFFDGKLVARGGSCHPHNEKYVRVLLIGKKIEVSIGLADAVRIERSKIEDAKSQIRREAQQKVLLATRAAESELGELCTDTPAFRQKIVDELRYQIRRVCKNHLLVRDRGFIVDESAIASLDDLLDEMIGVVMDAPIQHDAAAHQMRIQQLKAVLATSDPSFQMSMKSLTKLAPAMLEGSAP